MGSKQRVLIRIPAEAPSIMLRALGGLPQVCELFGRRLFLLHDGILELGELLVDVLRLRHELRARGRRNVGHIATAGGAHMLAAGHS